MGRRQNGKPVTQQELAELLGIKREQVAYWENGTREPKAEQIFQIAEELGVSADYLLGFTDVPQYSPDKQAAHAFTGLSSDTLSFLKKYKDDVGGPEWKIIRMVEKLIKHPDILCYLCIAEERAISIASDMVANPMGFNSKWPDEWPEEEKRLSTVQEWETTLDAALFNVSNNAVRFAESVLNVRDVREALLKEDRDLQEILRESEQEG